MKFAIHGLHNNVINLIQYTWEKIWMSGFVCLYLLTYLKLFKTYLNLFNFLIWKITQLNWNVLILIILELSNADVFQNPVENLKQSLWRKYLTAFNC